MQTKFENPAQYEWGPFPFGDREYYSENFTQRTRSKIRSPRRNKGGFCLLSYREGIEPSLLTTTSFFPLPFVIFVSLCSLCEISWINFYRFDTGRIKHMMI